MKTPYYLIFAYSKEEPYAGDVNFILVDADSFTLHHEHSVLQGNPNVINTVEILKVMDKEPSSTVKFVKFYNVVEYLTNHPEIEIVNEWAIP